tara:strand:+ start:60961 stop:61806 length:846 start_codon:yes stop_codon:yes gene_type:complete
MWDFLKRLFSEEDGKVTVVVLDENNPNLASTFKLKSSDAIKLISVIVILAVILTITLFFLTPLSSIYQQRIDENFRDEVIEINERVIALQDSLTVRELQLEDLKNFVRSVPDTTFSVSEGVLNSISGMQSNLFLTNENVYTFDMLTRHESMNLLSVGRSSDFPSFYPVEGTITQRYSSDRGHFGIDIAAQSDSDFVSVADGMVIEATWTMNYGYVMVLQHKEGFITIYKHASRLYKKEGDYILKGDLLGTVGNRGVLSTGSHLHLEIWKNGVPQDPLLFLN